MNFKLMESYIKLCIELNKPITWTGLKYFKYAFK